VGYRGKLAEQERARVLRAQAWTLNEIAAELGVSKSSVSLWVRGVIFDEAARAARAGANRNRGGRARGPNRLAQRRIAEIERLAHEGRQRIGALSDRDLLIAGTALYAGEGSKTDGAVAFANSDPRMVILFCRWLRRFFVIDEARLRVYLYLHAGLDLDAACAFWSSTTGIPRSQFGKPYRAVPDPSIRRTKHPMGCPRVSYSCTTTHRGVMGLVEALLSSDVPSGVAQLAAAADC
jgi:predicted nucleic acid-binding protein